jgi:hypothetical protein
MAKVRKIGRRTGEDHRGSSKDRAARKVWMLGHFGDGTHVDCQHCGAQLDKATVQADRIIPGGSYRRSNIQPACGGCNVRRGANRCWGCPLLVACGTRELVAA